MNTAVEYLVSHGRAAALTRCRSAETWQPVRSDRVVLRSPRGLELGNVLGLAEGACDTSALAQGELLRRASAADEVLLSSLQEKSLALLDAAQTRIEADGLPLLALDAEFLLDGREAFLHVLRWGDVTLTPLLESLNSSFGTTVRMVDRGQPAAQNEHGCGSCGSCGSGGGCGSGDCGTKEKGGCSSGSCSKGSFKTADDLSDYFLRLRAEMLAHPRVPLL